MQKKKTENSNQRIMYIDYLKVFAAFAVILIHVSAQYYFSVEVSSIEWQTFNIYDSIARWSVPVFVMMSGVTLLSKERSIKSIYSKYILRLFTAFSFWGGYCAISSGGAMKQIFLNAMKGNGHLWFLPMIIGLYMCIPIFRKIIESDNLTKYFLGLTFIFTFLWPWIMQLTGHFGGAIVKEIVGALNTGFKNMNFHLTLGYAGYFVGGYYLNKIELKKRDRIFIYLLGLLGFMLTIFLTFTISMKLQKPISSYYDYLNVNVLLESTAVFVWFKYHRFSMIGLNKIVSKLAQYSFGVYLVHMVILKKFNLWFGLNALSFSPIYSVPILTFSIFVFSFIVSGILNQIPYLKKYIV